MQTEAAVRNLATQYPYDAYVDGHKSRCAATRREIAEQLKGEIEERLAKAGVEVLEARINHLAYAPEIAAAMLQRQQAGAIIAARQRIVEGAVGMVEMALDLLSQARRRRARQRAQGRDGQQPAGRAVRRPQHAAGRQHRDDLPVSEAGADGRAARRRAELVMAERKPFLLRIDRGVLDALQRWADDDLRSLNGQIEFVLRRALRETGRSASEPTVAGAEKAGTGAETGLQTGRSRPAAPLLLAFFPVRAAAAAGARRRPQRLAVIVEGQPADVAGDGAARPPCVETTTVTGLPSTPSRNASVQPQASVALIGRLVMAGLQRPGRHGQDLLDLLLEPLFRVDPLVLEQHGAVGPDEPRDRNHQDAS